MGFPPTILSRLVFARLDPDQFQQCFGQWIESLTTTLGGQVIAVDGKTVRGSFDRSGEHSAKHTSSALGLVGSV